MKLSLYTILFVCSVLSLKGQGPPITVETPVMLGLEGSGVRTFGRFIAREKSSSYAHIFAVPYNFTPTLQLAGIVPFKIIRPKNGDQVSGLSDLSLSLKYQLYKKDATAQTFRILARIVQSFPTSASSEAIKLGAGVYQTSVGLIFGKLNTSIGIYGDISYILTGDSARDRVKYNLSIGVPLLPQQYPAHQMNVYLELNGSYLLERSAQEFFVSPGLQFILGRRVLLETSLQLPLILPNHALDKTKIGFLLGGRFLIT